MKREESLVELTELLILMGKHLAASYLEASAKGNLPTRAQIGIMSVLADGKALSVKDIAQKLCLSSSAITQVIDGMVKSGLLGRKEDEQDRRRICIALTASGKKTLGVIKKKRLVVLRKMLSSLDDEELEQLLRLQGKIILNLK